MATNCSKTQRNASIRDRLQKSDPPARPQGEESLLLAPKTEAMVDAQTPATKEDIHQLLVEFHKDITVLRQDFTHTVSDLDESVRQLDSHLTLPEPSSTDQASEKVDRTIRIKKLEKNYDLHQDKLDDLENHSRLSENGKFLTSEACPYASISLIKINEWRHALLKSLLSDTLTQLHQYRHVKASGVLGTSHVEGNSRYLMCT
ncbi:hypothetical protein NDU88_001301 [Pleurodeles waltl]|uniref:Uncharacterized protein n=1 Tax=Pleurodeles waltl TaxID=8319 RepID=A0AAV7S9Q8_PLEWA|nr:hypothetical protein NDU88_001301 [Pleurodeles waltl]